MAGFLVIDTETNGVMDYKRPADAPGQPRVAEFGAILLNDAGEIESEFQRYIRPPTRTEVDAGPSGWEWQMSPETTAINNITDAMLFEHGVPIDEVLTWYATKIGEGRAVVSFNAQFDCKMMRSELRRAALDDLFERTPNICLMRLARPFAKFAGRELVKAGGNGRGWPKLDDLCAFLGIERTDTHGALTDVRDHAACFIAMRKAGFEMVPEVHYAKNHEEIKNNG